ncbi:MAG: hypothetical protein O3C20_02220 [Verrucomicrobia bacterium]|nr:hypothetical protein [Verrucomicrobiota bacterium]
MVFSILGLLFWSSAVGEEDFIITTAQEEGLKFIGKPVINESGAVAFYGRRTDDTVAVFIGQAGIRDASILASVDGENIIGIGNGFTTYFPMFPTLLVDSPSINNNGTVAFVALAKKQAESPDQVTHRILKGPTADSHQLDIHGGIWRQTINDSGYLAFSSGALEFDGTLPVIKLSTPEILANPEQGSFTAAIHDRNTNLSFPFISGPAMNNSGQFVYAAIPLADATTYSIFRSINISEWLSQPMPPQYEFPSSVLDGFIDPPESLEFTNSGKIACIGRHTDLGTGIFAGTGSEIVHLPMDQYETILSLAMNDDGDIAFLALKNGSTGIIQWPRP